MTDLLCALVDESVTPLIRPFSVFNSLLEQRLRNTSDNFLSSSKIVDGTACAGGNTISFACRFKNVVAFEIDELRWNDLLFNLNLLKINHVSIGNAPQSCIPQVFNLTADIFFFDPPWGGKNYKALTEMPMFLGDHDIADITFRLRGNCRLVAIKAPVNFSLQSFVDVNCVSAKIENGHISHLSEYIFQFKFEKMILLIVYYPENGPLVSISAAVPFQSVVRRIVEWKQRHQAENEVLFLDPFKKTWLLLGKFDETKFN